jgi:hypothetical protein
LRVQLTEALKCCRRQHMDQTEVEESLVWHRLISHGLTIGKPFAGQYSSRLG